MLLVDELVRFGDGLDARHHHPVATTAAEAWALEDPVFIRSSASHVFVARRRGADERLVLRLRPDDDRHREVMHRAARAAASWAALGAPMATAHPSVDGRLVEHVAGYVVMAMRAVEGDTLDEGGLPERAGAWGSALARLHAADPGIEQLPHATALLATDTGDSVLRERAVELLAELEALPRTPDVHGVLHGDPEADNVVMAEGSGWCFVDPDEVRRGWFASDLAFALRDWSRPGDGPDLDADVPRRVLEGYRQERELSEEEVSWLPLFARVSAVEDLLAFEPHLAAGPDDGWPPWAVRLDARVRERAALLRDAVVGPGTTG